MQRPWHLNLTQPLLKSATLVCIVWSFKFRWASTRRHHNWPKYTWFTEKSMQIIVGKRLWKELLDGPALSRHLWGHTVSIDAKVLVFTPIEFENAESILKPHTPQHSKSMWQIFAVLAFSHLWKYRNDHSVNRGFKLILFLVLWHTLPNTKWNKRSEPSNHRYQPTEEAVFFSSKMALPVEQQPIRNNSS